MRSLTIRNVEVAGRDGLDVRIEAGRIVAIGPKLTAGGNDLDGRGGALIPGLCDHHIHLFGLAAQADSVTLEGVVSRADFAARLTAATAVRAPGSWVRILGYHERMAGDLTRQTLDQIAPRHRLRVQHQTGALWVLNSLALGTLGEGDDPAGLERDVGHLWRGDAWLRARIGSDAPPLAPIGRRLAAYGITHLTDASVNTEADAADRLAAAHRAGDLPQHLMLMSGGPLEAPGDGAFTVGSLKILLDDHALPEFDDFIGRIADARAQQRSVAVHCVTAAELALSLAAFEAAGVLLGDRIEHGGVIPQSAIAQLKALGLAVVTQPAFIRERGDRYALDVAPDEQPDLYRCASLLAAGVPVAGSSDAPYASPDPWLGIAAAIDRKTAAGRLLGAGEAVSGPAALSLYLDAPQGPGRRRRKVEAGAPADLCLLRAPCSEILADPGSNAVVTTLVGGRIVHHVD